ncbi:MAG: DUF2975 domain-containing protein [Oscillibacter sp.]|jgi:hypothetical protein|nr:DUF2975 domain-containing protein [Oscillibacter sp.]
MEHHSARGIARILKVLVDVTFVCNLAAIPAVPFAVSRLHEEAGRSALDAYHLVLALFLCFCGCCTAVVLRQARRVLDTVIAGEPFCMDNAVSLRRAAVSAFLISGAAALRVVWGLVTYRSVHPLLTYNALFVPVFAMAGLLCLVMSALFRRAAEIKAENDLTI